MGPSRSRSTAVTEAPLAAELDPGASAAAGLGPAAVRPLDDAQLRIGAMYGRFGCRRIEIPTLAGVVPFDRASDGGRANLVAFTDAASWPRVNLVDRSGSTAHSFPVSDLLPSLCPYISGSDAPG